MSAVVLVPVMALADRAGLSDLVAGHVRLGAPGGCNPAVKVSALVAGMVAGADSIEDMDLLHHGGMHRSYRRAWIHRVSGGLGGCRDEIMPS